MSVGKIVAVAMVLSTAAPGGAARAFPPPSSPPPPPPLATWNSIRAQMPPGSILFIDRDDHSQFPTDQWKPCGRLHTEGPGSIAAYCFVKVK